MLGGIHVPVKLNPKKGAKSSDDQSNGPPLKFIQLPSSIYHIYPECRAYNPCPEGCGVIVVLKDIIAGTFNYVEQNYYLQILMGFVREICISG